MTREQHLLICLAEECSEVQKEVMKIMRFGMVKKGEKLHKTLKGYEVPPNHESLKREVIDLLAVVEMLTDAGLLDFKGPEAVEAEMAFNTKKEKVEKYMEYAHNLGQLKMK